MTGWPTPGRSAPPRSPVDASDWTLWLLPRFGIDVTDRMAQRIISRWMGVVAASLGHHVVWAIGHGLPGPVRRLAPYVAISLPNVALTTPALLHWLWSEQGPCVGTLDMRRFESSQGGPDVQARHLAWRVVRTCPQRPCCNRRPGAIYLTQPAHPTRPPATL